MISVKKILPFFCLAITFNSVNASCASLSDQMRRETESIATLCTHVEVDTSNIRHTVAETLRDKKPLIERICSEIKELESRIRIANDKFDEIANHLITMRELISTRDRVEAYIAERLYSEQERSNEELRATRDELAKTKETLDKFVKDREESEKALADILSDDPRTSPMLRATQERLRSKQATPIEVFLYGCLVNLAMENERLQSMIEE